MTGGREKRKGETQTRASQEGGPANAHATARHVFFAHLGTPSLQGSKTAEAAAAVAAAAGGRGRADGAASSISSSNGISSKRQTDSTLPSLTANFWFVDPSSPRKLFACPTPAHDDGLGHGRHGRGRGNGMGEPVGIGETQRDIVAVKLFRRRTNLSSTFLPSAARMPCHATITTLRPSMEPQRKGSPRI